MNWIKQSLFLFILTWLIATPIYAQQHKKQSIPSNESDYEVEVDLSKYCENQKKPTPIATEAGTCSNCVENEKVKKSLDFSKILQAIPQNEATNTSCDLVNAYNKLSRNQPDKGDLTILQKDQDGKKWKIKLYFGPTRTKYYPTRVHLQSSKVNVVINDFKFPERTGMHNYDVSKWNNLQNALQWIDEPTNTIILEFQKGKNSFFLNIFHPKFLTNAEDVESNPGFVSGEVSGNYINQPMLISDKNATSSQQLGIKLQNTHRQMDWQIGYSRKILLLEDHGMKVVFSPHVAAGISTGKTQSSYKDSEGRIEEYESAGEVQGVNLSCGARIDYELGRCSFFVDNRITFSKLQHPFLDGKATYDMKYLTNTMGISFQLNKTKPKKKK